MKSLMICEILNEVHDKSYNLDRSFKGNLNESNKPLLDSILFSDCFDKQFNGPSHFTLRKLRKLILLELNFGHIDIKSVRNRKT